MENTWSQPFRYWILTTCTIFAGYLIWFLQDMFAPLIISALMAYVLNPFVSYVADNTGRSRSFVVGIMFLLGITLLIVLPILLFPPFIDGLDILVNDLEQFLIQTEETLNQPIVVLGQSINFGDILPDLTEFVPDLSLILENAAHLLETTSVNFLWFLIILVAMYYFLRDWNELRSWIYTHVPTPYKPDAQRMYYDIRDVWHGYLMGNVAMMAIVSVMFAVPWIIIGVPGGIFLGILTGILTIIPDLGPAVAVALTALVALFEGSNASYITMENGWFAVLVTVIYLVLVNVKNIWVRPLVFGRTLHMHEGLVFIIIMVSILVGGVMGALVAIPAVASTAVVAKYIFRKMQGLDPWPVVVVEADPIEETLE